MLVYLKQFIEKLIRNFVKKLRGVDITESQLKSLSETFREISVGIFVALIISAIIEKQAIDWSHFIGFVLGVAIWYINYKLQKSKA